MRLHPLSVPSEAAELVQQIADRTGVPLASAHRVVLLDALGVEQTDIPGVVRDVREALSEVRGAPRTPHSDSAHGGGGVEHDGASR